MYIKQYYVVRNNDGNFNGHLDPVPENAGPHLDYFGAVNVLCSFQPNYAKIVSTKLEVEDC